MVGNTAAWTGRVLINLTLSANLYGLRYITTAGELLWPAFVQE